jgi:hypothetical protein
MRNLGYLMAIALLAGPSPALAGASNFTLVNSTGAAISDVAIRRTTTNDWKPLGAAPSPGARQSVQFTDPDCAFDIRAKVVGGAEVIWNGVNLCEVKSVILNRNETGQAWADYE